MEDPYGSVDLDLARPPLLLGCERTPFIAAVGAGAFAVVVLFGITFTGVTAGGMLVVAAVMVLRRVAAYDPFFFAVHAEGLGFPRHMPDVLPDPSLPGHLPFVGFDDPPRRETVLLARAVPAAVVLSAAAAASLFAVLS